jgi:hypothetical protein
VERGGRDQDERKKWVRTGMREGEEEQQGPSLENEQMKP